MMKINCKINLKRDIKSSIYICRVFSFLEQRQKLKILRNNKQLQKMIRINIQDFISISDRYKVIEKNGKGKEYY